MPSNNIWGVFDKSGQPIALADTVLSVAYDNENKASDFPVERGGFATYNKTNSPFEIEVQMVKGGTDAVLSEFIAALDRWNNSTDLCDVVTPSQTYLDMTLVRFGYSRSSENGTGMVKASLNLVQVRQVEPQYTTVANLKPITQTKSTSAVTTKETGKQQGQEPSQSLLDKALSKGKALFKS